MKKWLCVFLIVAANVMAARNRPLQSALPDAKTQVLKMRIEHGISLGDAEKEWGDFLSFASPSFEPAPSRDQAGYTSWLVAEFDKWKSNTMIHEDEEGFGDEDTRSEFDPSRASSSALTSPARSVADGGGSVAGGGGSGSVLGGGSMVSGGTSLSTRVYGIAGSGIARTTACLQEMKDIRAALDLTRPQSRDGLRDRLDALSAADREAAFKEILHDSGSAALRASYIKVLLADARHRREVLAAINDPANAGFRAALIEALLANDGARGEILTALHTNYSGDMIAKVVSDRRPAVIAALIPAHLAEVINALITTHIGDFTALLGNNDAFRTATVNALVGDGPNRATIAQAFVDSADFRNALIPLLEAGRFAINANRMLWHDIDGVDPHTAFWGALRNGVIVTNDAFEHLLAKTRDGYQAISSLTRQRGKFRAAFADGNLVGKNGTHIGSRKAQ